MIRPKTVSKVILVFDDLSTAVHSAQDVLNSLGKILVDSSDQTKVERISSPQRKPKKYPLARTRISKTELKEMIYLREEENISFREIAHRLGRGGDGGHYSKYHKLYGMGIDIFHPKFTFDPQG